MKNFNNPYGQAFQKKTDDKTLLQKAMQYLQAGMPLQAKNACHHALKINSKNADALHLLGLISAKSGKHADAVHLIGQSLEINPHNPAALNNRGIALKKIQNSADAILDFEKAIALRPDYVEAHNNLGNALLDLHRAEDALHHYQQAILLKPDFVEGYNNRGNAFFELNRLDDALDSFDKAIGMNRHYAEAYNNKGRALLALGRATEALVLLDNAIALRPGYVEAHNNRGNALAALKRHGDALASYDTAIQLAPDHAIAYSNRGSALVELRHYGDAIRYFDKAIALSPDFSEAYENRGQAALKAKNYALAIDSFQRLVDIDAHYPFAKGHLLHAKMLCCNWGDYDALCHAIQNDLQTRNKSAEPFGYQGIGESEADLRVCAEIFAESEYPNKAPIFKQTHADPKKKLTIGYLCGEFRKQATTILLCGVFECHDKTKFHLVAFDNGSDDGSDYRARVKASFDEIIDITKMADLEAATLITAKGVDILINLNGYFGDGRMGIFAYRPSPIQVNYLGFPGTMGTTYFDYLIADDIVIPRSSQAFYTEKIAYLPDCYQANDSRRQIADTEFSRSGVGLPPDAFVFCCFNNSYKITPGTFDVWMRVLQRVDGGVLWLLADNSDASENLRTQAEMRGISGSRLIFAERMPLEEHLARHRLGDLFLDTLPYNAHTTASDALWAGLPVLTQTGTTFPGRVSTSLLNALDLGELVTQTTQGYEDRAVELAINRAMLHAITQKLAHNRLTMPLFDTPRFTKHLEAAFLTMHVRSQLDSPPDHIYLKP